MSLVPLDQMLKDAQKNRYAVGAFDIISLNALNGIAEGIESENTPAVIAICEGHFPYFNFEQLAQAAHTVAEALPGPVALHLDHGCTLETAIRSIDLGFTGVMFDGSLLPFDENVSRTREVVQMAHAKGIPVEAELGNIGGAEGGVGPTEVILTDPDAAVAFVERTGCDALAVAIGTAHGLYRGKPQLDLDRLDTLRNRLGIPLVLHGGTGLSDDDIRNCVARGICKLNVYTDLNVVATQAVRKRLEDPGFFNYPETLVDVREAIRDCVIGWLRLLKNVQA